jgi:hypothetical protein
MPEIFSFILSLASAATLRWLGPGLVVVAAIVSAINGLAFKGRITWTSVLVAFATCLTIAGVLFGYIGNAPRSLSTGQQATIANKLRPLAPERIDIDVFPETREAASLAEQIDNAIKLAGWERVSRIDNTRLPGMVVSGVDVLMTQGSEKSRRCAEGLRDALRDAGIDASVGDIPLPPQDCAKDDPYCSRVLVEVGERP